MSQHQFCVICGLHLTSCMCHLIFTSDLTGLDFEFPPISPSTTPTLSAPMQTPSDSSQMQSEDCQASSYTSPSIRPRPFPESPTEFSILTPASANIDTDQSIDILQATDDNFYGIPLDTFDLLSLPSSDTQDALVFCSFKQPSMPDEFVYDESFSAPMWSPTEDGVLDEPRTPGVASSTRPKCDTCHRTFRTQALLREHQKLHSKPYICPVCRESRASHSAIRFSQIRDLHRHFWTKHPDYAKEEKIPSEERSCPFPPCDYKGRKDNLKRHCERVHQENVIWKKDEIYVRAKRKG